MLKNMSKRTKLILLALVTLIVVFIISYSVTDLYLDKKHGKEITEEEKRVAATKTDELDEKIKISFYTGDSRDTEKTVKEYKNENDITTLSYKGLIELVGKEGYEISSLGDETISFKRDKNIVIEKDRYYLGFKDDKLAVFKGKDDNTLEFIEYGPHLEDEGPKTKLDIESSLGDEAAEKVSSNQISSDTLDGIREEASDY